MDAPYYNGEPGAMPYDDEWSDRREPPSRELTCDDCAATGTDGFTLVGSTGRIFCSDCARRRGLAYLFDPRRWAEIAKALQQRSA